MTGHLRRLTALAARRPTLTALALLALLVLAAYVNGLPNAFVIDDALIIEDNPLVHGIRNVPRLFRAHYWEGTQIDQDRFVAAGPRLYRPLVMATYALNYTLGGLAPAGFRVVNILLHAGVSAALWALARRLGWSRGGATAAAAIFAVHPIHTEAVTGIVGRAELMMSLGVLGCLLWYPAAGERPAAHARALLASLGAFAAALLSKEQALVLPGLFLLAEVCTGRRPGPGARDWARAALAWARRLAPLLAVLAAYLALRGLVVGSFVDPTRAPLFHDNPLAHVDTATRVLTALKVAGRYLWLTMWPAALSADYSHRAIPLSESLVESAVLGGLAAWTALLAVGAVAFLRGHPRVAFATGLTAISFLPASNLLVATGTVMGERLFYLPSAGLCLLAASLWEAGRAWASPDRRRVRGGLAVLLALVVALLAARTAVRNRDWTSHVTIWRAAARVVPGSCKVHNALARLATDPKEIVRESEIALAICPDLGTTDAAFLLVYGTGLLRDGRVDEAVERLETSRILRVSHDANYNLGLAYLRQRRWPEAETALRNALAVAPERADAHNSLSVALRIQGRHVEALAEAEAAVSRDPRLAEGHYNRGRALEALGDRPAAILAYQEALRLKPSLEIARSRLQGLGSPGAP